MTKPATKTPAAAETLSPAEQKRAEQRAKRGIAPTPSGKTYFEPISEGRSPTGEQVRPDAIVLAGVSPETADVAAQGEEEAAEVQRLMMATNKEVRCFLEDPNKFFETWPVEADRAHMLNILIGQLSLGTNVEPATVRRVGAYYVAENGRHRIAAMVVLRRVLRGEIAVDVIRGEVARCREERGVDYLPVLTAIPPPKDAATGKAMEAGALAELSQQVRLMHPREKFDRAMLRINAATAATKTPDLAGIARNLGVKQGTVEGWRRLAKMHPSVQAAVLDGYGDDGKFFPLTSALAFAPLSPSEQAEKVKAMIAAGETGVATAKATAAVAKAPTREIETGAESSSNQGESGASRPAREPGGHERIAKPGWGKVELVRFLRVASAKPSASPMLRGLLAIMTEGPDAMADIDRHAVPGLHDYLKTLAD